MDIVFPKVHAGEQPSASRDNSIAAEVMRLSRALGGSGFISNGSGNFLGPDGEPTIRVLNTGSEEIPAFAVMEIAVGLALTNYAETGRQKYIPVRKNDGTGYGAQYSHLINGPQPISAGAYGRIPAYQDYVWAYYDTSNAPTAIGHVVGPTASSWKLKLAVGGYQVVGPIIASEQVVLVARCPCLEFEGTATTTTAKGGTATITAPGSVSVSVLCQYSGVTSGNKVRAAWRPTQVGSTEWELVDKECSS